MVTSESVSKACSEVSRYSEEQMASEFERFFVSQPAICEFVTGLTNSSGQQIQEISLFLSYMVVKTVEVAAPSHLAAVPQETLQTALRDAETWVHRMAGAEGSDVQSAALTGLASGSEPLLLQYVMSALNQPLDDGAELPDERKGEVFFVLKTVISSLSRSF